MSAASASYLPDCQVIRLKWDFAAFADPGNIRGIVGPTEVGVFFHEWVHYLHNVSTILGLSAFGNQVALWSEFRSTIDSSGLSAGDKMVPPKRLQVIEQRVAFMTASRLRQQQAIPGLRDVRQLQIKHVQPLETPLLNTELALTVLVCKSEILQNSGAPEPVEVRIGVVEILGSVAVMLEGELVRRLGGIEQPAMVVPYGLLGALGSHLAPSLTPQKLIFCALASLQSSDPPSALVEIFELAETATAAGRDPLAVLLRWANSTLKAQEDWIETTLSDIEKAFPVDEPLARAIKATVNTFRDDFAARRNNPFFEFGIIHKLATDVQQMDDVVRGFGGCCIIQERSGEPNEVARDLMYDFALGPQDDVLEFGWRKMHASFRFVSLHTTSTGFRSTSQITLREATKCPFYSACRYPLRKVTPEVCAREPWNSASMPDGGMPCWYATAVRDMRPPSVPTALGI